MKQQGTPFSLEEEIRNLLLKREVGIFIYYTVIMITGFLILSFLGRREFIFGLDIAIMGVWLLLIILLDPPESAGFDAEPFEDIGIIDKSN